MIYERLRVFVSSRMQELASERMAMKAALSELNIDCWIFEEDAGARPEGIQQTYKEEIEKADLWIGLFWLDYGNYTIDEFNYATERNKDCLIYEKRADINSKRDPKLQTFLDQIGKVETGLTIRRFNSMKEMHEGVKQDAARWQTQKIRELRELNISYKPSPLEASEQVELKILLSKVKHFWIKGVLERTIQRASLLELGKDTQPEAVGNPWEAVLELPFEGSRAVPSSKSISDVFDDVEHSVLILGQPGSGKTTTLLTLVRELILRVEINPTLPVPVVFHLSSWIGPEQPLDTWLMNELNDKYQIPKKIGKTWLEHQRLVLLLDGLDEVTGENRPACVEAINRFAKEIGLPGMVVCCRLKEYEELRVKLTLNGDICLRPLTDGQVDAYVEEGGAELVGLINSLRQDPVLLELARSPLMLNLMCLIYRGYTAESIARRETAEDRTEHLFTAYIDLMFKKQGTAEFSYSRERTLSWLSWIAKRLSEHNQELFMIENMQPNWLSNGTQRWAYLAGVSLVLGLLMGLASIAFWGAGSYIIPKAYSNTEYLQPREWIIWLTAMPVWLLVFGWIEGLGSRSDRPVLERVPPGIWRAAVKDLISVGLWSLVALMAVGLVWLFETKPKGDLLLHLLWLGTGIAFVFGASGYNRSFIYSINTVESLRWSLLNAWPGALLGLISGLLVGFPLLFIDDLPGPQWIPFLGFAIIGLGFGGILGGLTPNIKDTKTMPNQGIRLSFRMAMIMSLNALWLAAIPVAIAWAGNFHYEPSFKLNGFYVPGLGYFTGMLLVLFFWFGGVEVIKHYVLRTVLSASGQTPWNLIHFLDKVHSLDLMQSVGNAYIFIHRRLLEYLANLGKEK